MTSMLCVLLTLAAACSSDTEDPVSETTSTETITTFAADLFPKELRQSVLNPKSTECPYGEKYRNKCNWLYCDPTDGSIDITMKECHENFNCEIVAEHMTDDECHGRCDCYKEEGIVTCEGKGCYYTHIKKHH